MNNSEVEHVTQDALARAIRGASSHSRRAGELSHSQSAPTKTLTVFQTESYTGLACRLEVLQVFSLTEPTHRTSRGARKDNGLF